MDEPSFCDDRGNMIFGSVPASAEIVFGGSKNVVRIAEDAKISSLTLHFPMSCSEFILGSCSNRVNFSARIGQDCLVDIGDGVSTASKCHISASEGATITIGEDAMISTDVRLATDDSHPIFDIHTGKRVNISRDINVGSHVWIGRDALVLGGATIGPGSVVGAASVVKGTFPNNCIIAGAPARITRKDIAWERPHLANTHPPYKLDADSVERTSAFWRRTEDVGISSRLAALVRRLMRKSIAL